MITSIYDGETNQRKHQTRAAFYDFHHQVRDETVIQVTGGDKFIVDCYYDERDAHPKASVLFGLGTFDEMCESCVM